MKMFHPLLALSAAIGLFVVAGCNQQSATPTPDSTPPAETSTDQASGDVEEGQDHSVVGHTHGAGPHDGTIADWGGGKYHAEFTVDHDKQEATVYILGPDEKTATPIKAEEILLIIKDPAMEVTLKATPQDDDPADAASRYVGNHEKLAVVQEYAGTITGVIDGTPYSGDFAEVAHDHE
ncbi:MAG: hypothetical protein CBB71_16980 [Rhodopirellula sp. TMED11]|nr:MAG: hypothetical protein CBB71_16980 [Rhodopirellula sp. TMED11]